MQSREKLRLAKMLISIIFLKRRMQYLINLGQKPQIQMTDGFLVIDSGVRMSARVAQVTENVKFVCIEVNANRN